MRSRACLRMRTGEYSLQGEPDMAFAARLLHSRQYHRFKARFMAPVDAFFVEMSQRTDAAVAASARAGTFFARNA